MKRFILFFFLIGGTYIANAQKFHFGLKIAPGIAWLKSDTKSLDNDGVKLGFSYGIITEFALNKNENYSVATGFEVAYRGGKTSQLVSITDANGAIINSVIKKTKYSLEYLELPVTLKMKTNEIGAFRYFGQFGIVPGINIKAKVTDDTEGNFFTDGSKSDINSFAASVLIALGLEYNLVGSTSMVVSAGFNNGLTDVLDVNRTKAITNLVSLNVGILF